MGDRLGKPRAVGVIFSRDSSALDYRVFFTTASRPAIKYE